MQPLKEKTAREKALEFAKNVPKPRIKNDVAGDLVNIEEEPFDEYGNTIKGAGEL